MNAPIVCITARLEREVAHALECAWQRYIETRDNFRRGLPGSDHEQAREEYQRILKQWTAISRKEIPPELQARVTKEVEDENARRKKPGSERTPCEIRRTG